MVDRRRAAGGRLRHPRLTGRDHRPGHRPDGRLVHAAHGPPPAAEDRDRLLDPKAHLSPQLARLADTKARRDQTDSDRLLGWLTSRGLAPHGHSHQRIDNRQPTDLERLARLRGMRLDLSFLDVMLARDRTGITICGAEVRHGRLPEVRQLARRMLIDQQQELQQLRAWKQVWSTASSHHPNRAKLGS
jgi:phage-related minor tail protein